MHLENFKTQLKWNVPVVFLVILLPIAIYNSLLFHTLVESFAIIVAIVTFLVAYNTYAYSQSHYLMYIGCGYFWIGVLDFCHTILFSNAPAYTISNNINSGTTIQFWILARFVEVGVLVSFTSFINRKINKNRLFWFFGGVSTALALLILSGNFPLMFDAKTGLTKEKIIAEYIIIFLLIIAARRLWFYRREFNRSIYKLLMVSICLTICAEISFTLYIDLSGSTLIIGHLFKLISYWYLYVALVESTLTQPFKSLSLTSNTFNALPDLIAVVDDKCNILHANSSAVAFHKNIRTKQNEIIIGQHVHEVFHSQKITAAECIICISILQKTPIKYQELKLNGEWHEVTLSLINYLTVDNVVLHVTRNINDRKEIQNKLQTTNRLYKVLRLTNKAIMSSKNKQSLLDSICHISVQHGGFSLAWIGMIEGDSIVPTSIAGHSKQYVQNINVRVDDSNLARGPVGIAATQNKVACVNHIETDPSFKPWRDAAIACGFKSLAAIPVILNEQCIGVFAIYASQSQAFDAQTLELLSSLSHDISGVITFVNAEESRLKVETKLKQLSRAISQTKSAVIISDVEGLIEYVNPYYSEITGYSYEDILTKNIKNIAQEIAEENRLTECWQKVLNGESWRGEVAYLTRDNQTFWAMQSVSPIFDQQNKVTHIVWTLEDNTELHHAHETIRQQAHYDPLTNLPNRRLFQDRFNFAITTANRHQKKIALFYLDLDDFKLINDELGHDCGDLVLQHTAKILISCIRETDTVTRLGGDEFSVLINDILDKKDVVNIVNNMFKKLNKKIMLNENEIIISTSIGISIYPDDAENIDGLMKCADTAMYKAKQAGKNNYQLFC